MPVRRKIIALLVTILAAVAWCATAAAPAQAGGPTSVLLANPAAGRAHALYYSDPAYDRLASAVGAFSDEAGSASKPESVVDDFGSEIRLTWLIHDMSIWRIDRVHTTAKDGTWIETVRTDDGGGDVFDRPGSWHRPHDQRLLMASLTAAGLLTRAQRAAGDPTATMPTAAVPTLAQAAPTVAHSAPSGAVATGRTAVPVPAMIAGGAVGGVVVGAVAALLLARPRTRTPQSKPPRVVLTG
jgi:hypothetical protein